MDKRRNKKGKWEYLIRWKGYGSKEDTWEPEHHLLHCEEFIDQFHSLRLHSHKRPKMTKNRAQMFAASHPSATESSRSRAEARKKKRTYGPAVGVRVGTVLEIGSGGSGPTQKQRKVGVGPGKHSLGDKMSKAMTYKVPPPGGPHFVHPVRIPQNGLQNGEMDPLIYRTESRPYRLPSDRMGGKLGDMHTTGQQLTTELGKISKYISKSLMLLRKILVLLWYSLLNDP